MTGVAVPVKAPVHEPFGTPAAVHGVNEMYPVEGLTVYVPCALVNVVPVQLGADCEPVHSFTVDATSATPEGAVSFVKGFIDCVAPARPLDESGLAASAAGGFTVAVMVEVAICPTESVTR